MLDLRVCIAECDAHEKKLRDVMRDYSHTMQLVEGVNVDDVVIPYRALISQSSRLTYIGDYVQCGDKVRTIYILLN